MERFNHQIWILAAGRLLSQIGTGFTLFYAPIFFVNQVGLSATKVGIGLGINSVLGIFGRFLGGMWTDSPKMGRKPTLLLSAAISAIADVFLALTHNFPTLVLGNLLMGLGIGLYWPSTEAAIADLTTPDQRNEAFAVTRLADTIGLGLGVVLGGVWIARAGNYRSLFVIDGVSFVVFFVVIYVAITETGNFEPEQKISSQSWMVAFKDRALMIFMVVNIFITTYISQIQTTMPLYFKNFVGAGFSPTEISIIFTCHIIFAAICQLPVARFLNRFTRPQALMISLLFWAIGFVLVWLTAIIGYYPFIWAMVAVGVLGIALVCYTPSSSALVADLAPQSLLGVYLSLSSQCWAIGYLIGPPLGGWALDQSVTIVHSFWLAGAASTIIGIIILYFLDKKIAS